jgi:isopenicillin-N epimerase
MSDWVSGSPDVRALWALDPEVTYLNHGSFGATPRSVLAEQDKLRAELEREPVLFLGRTHFARVAAVRAQVAEFLGADAEGLAFVQNATTGVETALDAIDWRADDEVVFCDHGYNAVKRQLNRLHDRFGVNAVYAAAPFPLADAEQIVDAYAAAIGPKTRLVVVDHITSATALIFPVERIVELCRARGVPVLVDGAHGPGMLPLDLRSLGADFYTGNLHKWMCAAKGTAIFYAAPQWRARVHPRIASHFYQQGFNLEFDWTGTIDSTARLCLPAVLAHGNSLGWERLRASNHALVREGRERVAHALGVELPHADDPQLYGSMAAIPFPWATQQEGWGLCERLYNEHRIEMPFTGYDGRCFVRISGQAYNSTADYERLARVLKDFR